MNWFLNVSTRTKLLFGFGLMAALIVAVFVAGYIANQALIDSQRHIFDANFNEVVDALTFDANESDIRLATLSMSLTTNRADLEEMHKAVNELSDKANDLLRSLINRNQTNSIILDQLTRWRTLREAYRETRENQVVPLLKAGQVEEARALQNGEQARRFDEMRSITSKLVENLRAEARNAIQAAEQRGRRLIWIAAWVGALSLLVVVSLTIYLNRLIAFPLQELLVRTERMAAGDLSVDIPGTLRRDEVGVLQEAFRRMLEKLRAMNREIQESVNSLAASASQILTATSQMAATASETAAASTQTTATVEQVKQTAQVSNSKARQVADTAQRAARDSEGGRTAVDEGIEGMNRIRSQMEEIAGSIVRLSEQSQAIGEIISSVTDLAEQSNLLAVNASIEAAKAGEHGKGFAVVAQEIRNLAAQSKQATAQVRSILGDIQKATNSAVLATEQGSKAVDSGVRQSAQAGEAIRALAETISLAAEAAQQISASSEQQAVGMDQVAQAMESIKQAATQNANATRQAESGARNLHELGQKLKELVARFKM